MAKLLPVNNKGKWRCLSNQAYVPERVAIFYASSKIRELLFSGAIAVSALPLKNFVVQ